MISNEQIIIALIEKAKQDRGIISIRSRFGNEYARPDALKLKGRKRKTMVPDLVIQYTQHADLYIIEQDTEYDIERWRLLSLYALKMQGQLHIVTSKDNEAHINSKLEESSISARLILFSQ
jgi:hypothetical protein